MTALNPALQDTLDPPVMEARRWLAETALPEGLPLINLSQAAPVDPPPAAMLDAMAQAVRDDPSVHLYGPVLGLPALRAALAERINSIHGSNLSAAHVAITSGCNQAFCVAISSLAQPGDEIILPVPWYFNHAMWLTQQRVIPVPLQTDARMLPDPDACARLITPRTRAIVLISPNNPTGVEYPPALIAAFHALAAKHGIALILDETYRDFHSAEGAPHDLFRDPAWDETLIHLYSFSKAYRLTGHRVGAVACAPARLHQIEKILDTVTICPSTLGQTAALWGLRHLDEWLAGERAEILRRRAALETAFQRLPDWQLLGCGAYFAYVRHPFDAPSPEVARTLLARLSLLVLPGTMFRPADDPAGASELRIAFANADAELIGTMVERLAGMPAIDRPR